MGNTIVGQLLLQVVLIALNAVFACAEIAVLSFNGAKLEKLSEEGNKRAHPPCAAHLPARAFSCNHPGRHHAFRLPRQRVRCG